MYFAYVMSICVSIRTAKETEDNIKRAVQKGERLPEEDQFDSNCITPGMIEQSYQLIFGECLP